MLLTQQKYFKQFTDLVDVIFESDKKELEVIILNAVLNQVSKQMEDIQKNLQQDEFDILTGGMRQGYRRGAVNATGQINRIEPKRQPAKFTGLSSQDLTLLRMLEDTNFDLISSLTSKQMAIAKRIFTDGLTNGRSRLQIKKEIMSQLGTTEFDTRRIVYTEIVRTTATAHRKTFLQSNVTHWTWQTALDEKVCPVCGSLHGTTVKIGEEWNKYLSKSGIKKNRGEQITQPPAHPFCYSYDTEVLTDNGWKLFSKVRNDDKIFSLNPENHQPEWVEFVNRIKYHYKGKMIKFGNKTADLLVTPDHKMYVGKRHWKERSRVDYIFEDAKDVSSDRKLYVSSEWKGKNKDIKINDKIIDSELYCRFMGYYLSDGSSSYRKEQNYFTGKISQFKKHSYDIMWNDVIQLPFNFYRANGYIGFGSELGRYLHQFGKSETKYIPEEIKNMDKDNLRIFLDAFTLGDGHVRYKGSNLKGFTGKSKETTLFTISKQLMSDLCEVIIKAGYSCSVYKNKDRWAKIKGKEYWCKGTYVIRINKSTQRMLNNKTVEDYNNNVYCLELEKYHVMLVKRNGKISWCGNCRCGVIPAVPKPKSRFIKPKKERKIEPGFQGFNLSEKAIINQGIRELPDEIKNVVSALNGSEPIIKATGSIADNKIAQSIIPREILLDHLTSYGIYVGGNYNNIFLANWSNKYDWFHEIGHAVYDQYLSTKTKLVNKWKEIHDSMLESGTFITQRASTDIYEHFSDVFTAFILEPEYLSVKYPELYNFMKSNVFFDNKELIKTQSVGVKVG
jgi:SPP1 gp7 family putative phage head morphogenesis protein